MHPMNVLDSWITIWGLLDLASATGSRLISRILLTSRSHVSTRAGGQSNVRTAASSMMCSKRGLRCLTRKGASSPRNLVSDMSGNANGVDLRRLNDSSMQLETK